jgi:hypothetical protein
MRIARLNSLSAMCPIVAALATYLGCSSDQTTIEGAVSFDGQAVERGSITFEPVSGTGPSAGGTIENGRYKIDANGVTPGEMIVRISAVRPTGKKIEAGPPERSGTLVDEVRPYIPAAYNEQSTLKAQVKAGKVTQDFALKSRPPR